MRGGLPFSGDTSKTTPSNWHLFLNNLRLGPPEGNCACRPPTQGWGHTQTRVWMYHKEDRHENNQAPRTFTGWKNNNNINVSMLVVKPIWADIFPTAGFKNVRICCSFLCKYLPFLFPFRFGCFFLTDISGVRLGSWKGDKNMKTDKGQHLWVWKRAGRAKAAERL